MEERNADKARFGPCDRNQDPEGRSRDETGADTEGTYEDEPRTGANLNGVVSRETYGVDGGGGRDEYQGQVHGGYGDGDAVDGDAENDDDDDDDTITITLESLDKTRHRSYVVSRNDTIEVCASVSVSVSVSLCMYNHPLCMNL